MFEDILGKGKDDTIEEDKDSIIEGLKYNVEQKEKLIKDLVQQITQLEKLLEDQDNDIYGVI